MCTPLNNSVEKYYCYEIISNNVYGSFDRCQLGSNPSSARVFVGSHENPPLFRVEGGEVFAY